MKYLVAALIVFASCTAADAQSLSFFDLSNYANSTNPSDGIGASIRQSDPSLPFYETLSVTSDSGGSGATSVFDFKHVDGSLKLTVDFDLFISGGFTESQAVANAGIFFTVDEYSTFDMTGFIQADGDTGSTNLDVALRDMTLSGGIDGFVYSSEQRSLLTTDQYLEIGGLAGNENELLGSRSAILTPGHEYLINFNYFISSYKDIQTGATALGKFEFTVTGGASPPQPPTSPVPEPSSFIMWGTIACLFGVMRFRGVIPWGSQSC